MAPRPSGRLQGRSRRKSVSVAVRRSRAQKRGAKTTLVGECRHQSADNQALRRGSTFRLDGPSKQRTTTPDPEFMKEAHRSPRSPAPRPTDRRCDECAPFQSSPDIASHFGSLRSKERDQSGLQGRNFSGQHARLKRFQEHPSAVRQKKPGRLGRRRFSATLPRCADLPLSARKRAQNTQLRSL